MIRTRSVLLAAILSATAAFAQEPAKEKEPKPAGGEETSKEKPAVKKEEALVVEGERVPSPRDADPEAAKEEMERQPGGVSLVPEEEIRKGRAATLEDALHKTPGLLIRSRYGSAGDDPQVSIRGSGLRSNYHARGLNFLVNGMAFGDADGFGDFESFEPLFFKRIEVYKGANALRFGAGSLGGAINMVQRTGADADWIEARVEAGSYGYFKTYLGSGHKLEAFDYFVGVANTTSDGYRQHADIHRTRAFGTIGYEFDNGAQMRLDLNYVYASTDYPSDLTREEFEHHPRRTADSAVFYDDSRIYTYLRPALSLRAPLAKGVLFESAIQFSFQDLDHPLSFSVIDNATFSWGAESRIVLSNPLFDHANRFTAGLLYSQTRNRAKRYDPIGHGDRGALNSYQMQGAYNLRAYAEEEFDVLPELTGVVGLRCDYSQRQVDDHFRKEPFDPDPEDDDGVRWFAPVPKVGFIARPAKGVQVYGNVSRGWEPPVLIELTSPGNLSGHMDDLDPQRAIQGELGCRGKLWDRLQWDVAFYHSEMRNELRNLNVQPFPGAPFTIPRYENIDRSRHSGVEVGAEVVVLKDIASLWGHKDGGGDIIFGAQYTWSRFRFVRDDQFGNNRIPGAPEHAIGAEVRYEHPIGFYVSASADIVPRGFFVDSGNTERTPRFHLFNAKIGIDYKPWKLGIFLECRNILDRNFVSAVVTDSGNKAYYEPGDGRTFFGGVEWKW